MQMRTRFGPAAGVGTAKEATAEQPSQDQDVEANPGNSARSRIANYLCLASFGALLVFLLYRQFIQGCACPRAYVDHSHQDTCACDHDFFSCEYAAAS